MRKTSERRHSSVSPVCSLAAARRVWSLVQKVQYDVFGDWCKWRGGATGRALDLPSTGRGFKSYSGQKLHNNHGQVVHTYVPLSPSSITWCRPSGGDWCSAAGKVTAGLAESNGSLPPGGWLIVTCGLTACTPGSTRAGPTLGNEYESMGSLYLYLTEATNVYIQRWCSLSKRRLAPRNAFYVT